MRILVLATGVFDKGGISRYTRYQITALRDLFGESNVCVLSLLAPAPNGFEEAFPVDYFPVWQQKITRKVLFCKAAVASALRRKPTIVICNHLHLIPLAVAIRALTGAKIFVNAYGLELWSRSPAITRAYLRQADRIIADCGFAHSYVEQVCRIPSSRIAMNRDCVDIFRFTPKPTSASLLGKYGIPADSGRLRLLTLGRLAVRARHKGYDRLLHSVADIPPAERPLTIIGGDGNDRMRLQELSASLGLSDTTFFLGNIPEADLVDVYNLCDLFVLVSDRGPGRGEGLPLTLIEAAACGKAVIAGNEDGSVDAVVDGQTGYLVSPRDPTALRDRLIELDRDRTRLRNMGDNGLKFVHDHLRYESFRDRLKHLITFRTETNANAY